MHDAFNFNYLYIICIGKCIKNDVWSGLSATQHPVHIVVGSGDKLRYYPVDYVIVWRLGKNVQSVLKV